MINTCFASGLEPAASKIPQNYQNGAASSRAVIDVNELETRIPDK